MELERSDAEYKIRKHCLILDDTDYASILLSMEDCEWVPPAAYVGCLFRHGDDIFVIAKGENNNYYLVYI